MLKVLPSLGDHTNGLSGDGKIWDIKPRQNYNILKLFSTIFQCVVLPVADI